MTIQPVQAPPLLTSGGPQGLCEGALILTRRGIVPIEDIAAGEEVFTHRRRWRPVVAVTSQTAPTVKVHCVTLPGGLPVTADQWLLTRNARVLLESDATAGMSSARWTKARDLVEGDRVASPLDFGQPLPLPELPAALAGTDPADIIRIAAQMIGLKGKAGTALCPELAGWLETHFGPYGAGRHFPAWAVTMPEELRRAFLGGLVDLSPERQKCAVAMHSKRFMTGLRLLVCSLGYAAGLASAKGKGGSRAWPLSWAPTGGRRPDYNGSRWHSVARVERGPVSTVFQLHVIEDESCVADGLTVAAPLPPGR
ncbi:Hint domain-containing protein [Streptomyces cinereoruber]|uniref:Hint domain-containing protein n=1 Tax=Streptomyces cinereoruber TaxID=67260 RepID=UPI003C2D1BAA